MELTHFDEMGNARMVDVSEKENTDRIAIARGSITMSDAAFKAIRDKRVAKGDVLTVATTAGIMGAKRTFELIPMCHVIQLHKCGIEWELDEENLEVKAVCTVKCNGKTGAEMEALTGVTTALLTVYDMVKAVDKFMVLKDIYLVEKDGGKSGHIFNTI